MNRNMIAAFAFAAAMAAAMAAGIAAASAGNIIDEWANVKVPSAPALKPVTVDTKTTALLIIDMVKQTCNVRPRCGETVPHVEKFLAEARAKGVAVIYSLGPTGNSPDILDVLKPKDGEPLVKSGPDKFVNADLEKILKDKGIATVIVVGTLAHGGVMHTATGAGLRKFKVVVPVDGMSSVDLYSEQYTAWHLAHGPVFSKMVTLTKFDMIKF
ncbi:MAG TPA: cysteine hydrolase [Pseudolabrys sp.]|nr:cysteine hydrolase [Pseudolabrys sp.]